jgi:hypothetical protein
MPMTLHLFLFFCLVIAKAPPPPHSSVWEILNKGKELGVRSINFLILGDEIETRKS